MEDVVLAVEGRARGQDVRPAGEHGPGLQHFRREPDGHQGHPLLARRRHTSTTSTTGASARGTTRARPSTGQMSERHNFQRQLAGPAHPAVPGYTGATVGDDLYFQWTPVQHATPLPARRHQRPELHAPTRSARRLARRTRPARQDRPEEVRMPVGRGRARRRTGSVRALDDNGRGGGNLLGRPLASYFDSGRVTQSTPPPEAHGRCTHRSPGRRRRRPRSTGSSLTGNDGSKTQTDTYALSWTPTGRRHSTRREVAVHLDRPVASAPTAPSRRMPSWSSASASVATLPSLGTAGARPLSRSLGAAVTARFPNLTGCRWPAPPTTA